VSAEHARAVADLLVIVPTRGRPDNIRRVIEAWDATGAWDDAELLVARDADDPEAGRYVWSRTGVREMIYDEWQPMVAKLDRTAAAAGGRWAPFALGFAGDDHLPRTPGWARRYLEALAELGTGIVYGDDLLQGQRLPTQWAMTADIVHTLGRMVPAPVEHLYCDNAVMALGQSVGCIRYLSDVVIEHVHPVAGRAPLDDQYRRVNAPDQYRRDHDAYRRWVGNGLERDAAAVRALREEVTIGG
jgi:hypothetical protein